MKKDIVLDINGAEFRFAVSGADYRNYLDDLTMAKKTVPSDRLLLSTVHPEDRDALRPYIDQGLGLDICAALIEEYTEDVRITVKKSSGASNA